MTTTTTAIATEISVEGTSVAPSCGCSSPSSTRCAVATAMAAAKMRSSVDGMEEVSGSAAAAQKWGNLAVCRCGYRYRGVT